jgi:hypothetical protein
MEPTLIGYFPKQVATASDWFTTRGVKELCSVSEHLSPGPAGWIDRGAHNEMAAFDDEQAAWGVVPGGPANATYQLLAYRLFPVQFDRGQQRPFAVPPLAVQPLPDAYRRLGYDVVSRCGGYLFECSPLSCNYAADMTRVNEHCLVDDPAEAFRLAALFSQEEGAEPGPYYVVEVWRREEDGASKGERDGRGPAG